MTIQLLWTHLVVWMPAVPLPDDDDPGDHGGHHGDSGESQRHVHRVVVAHLNATDRVTLNCEAYFNPIEHKKSAFKSLGLHYNVILLNLVHNN